MDPIASAKRIIIAMQQVIKDGNSKLLKECILPLTGKRCVDMLVTELPVFEVSSTGGLKLLDHTPDVSIAEIYSATLGTLPIPVYFLVAMSYFFLTRVWGAIPLTTADNVDCKRNKAQPAEIYAWTVADLQKAVTMLPETSSGLNVHSRTA